MQKILLNVESKEIRYAHLKHGRLEDLLVERKKSRQITGNIYKGKVTNILNNIQSAFIDINENENGFIHISDILENKRKFEEMFEMDFDIEGQKKEEEEKNKKKDILSLLKIDQPVLVQVVKEPIGTKGARLTSNISIAGRYLVLLPNTPHRGVSRKIEDRQVRDKLKKLIRSFEMPQEMGLICRTSSANATADNLINEAGELFKNWEEIVTRFHETSGSALLYEESDIIKRAVVTAVDKKYDQIMADDYATYQRCKKIYQNYAEEHQLKIEFYHDKVPMFERFGIEKEIEHALRRKIWMKCGGYLFFDKTEAMHTIDVNSGRSSSENVKDVEESLVRINLEAAEEIARQLRLRNIGGLIICDFIDMRANRNQKRVLEHLREHMKEDSAKCTILGMSEFGLIEMTRQRTRESLAQTLCTACPYCSGKGMIKSHETTSIEIERMLKKLLAQRQYPCLKLITHPELAKYLREGDREYFLKLTEKADASIDFEQDDNFHLNEFHFQAEGQLLDV